MPEMVYAIPEGYGSVLGGVYCGSYAEAQLLLHTLEQSLRLTATPSKRERLDKWRKEVMGLMARSQQQSWKGWERPD